jgi:hypothetical protein
MIRAATNPTCVMSDGELRNRVQGDAPIFNEAADAITAPRRVVDSHRPAHAEKR